MNTEPRDLRPLRGNKKAPRAGSARGAAAAAVQRGSDRQRHRPLGSGADEPGVLGEHAGGVPGLRRLPLAEAPPSHSEDELQRLAAHIATCIAELEALGVSFRGFEDGLVDFPSQIGGRLAYLCWRLGEPAVEHWHEADDGFDRRMPIAPRAVAW